MIKLGITGGIGAGKSTVCEVFKSIGVPVFNADLEAKKLLDLDIVKNFLLQNFSIRHTIKRDASCQG